MRTVATRSGSPVTESLTLPRPRGENWLPQRRARPAHRHPGTQYLYDGLEPVEELDANNAVTAIQVSGLGVDDALARYDAGGLRYYLTDALGSTRALADASGTLTTRYADDPYGNVTLSGEAAANPYQFTGRENDGTGLYYYRARYYHPQAQRSISEDPIGLAGGVNKYAYVSGNPINFNDPRGLLIGGLVNAGECYGDYAAQYWADQQLRTGNLLYAIPGMLASLWTLSTSDSTALALLSAGTMPGATNFFEWAGNPAMYELGAKTVLTALWDKLGLAEMSVIERGAAILAKYGWGTFGISGGPWLSTLAQGPTPGGWLASTWILWYLNHNHTNENSDCGCQ